MLEITNTLKNIGKWYSLLFYYLLSLFFFIKLVGLRIFSKGVLENLMIFRDILKNIQWRKGDSGLQV